MKLIKLDKNILQTEVNALLRAMDGYRAQNIKDEFGEKASGVKFYLDAFKNSLCPRKGENILDALNRSNATIFQKFLKVDGKKFKDRADYLRFFDVSYRTYQHEAAHGPFNRVDTVEAAKAALHDYMDAKTLYYKAFVYKDPSFVSPEILHDYCKLGQKFLKRSLTLVEPAREPVAER